MKNSDESYIPFRFMALAIPAIDAAIGINWLPVLIVSLAAMLIWIWMEHVQTECPKWLSILRTVSLPLIGGYLLKGAATCWPGEGARWAVPLVLGMLALYATAKSADASIRAASVLRYGMYLVLLLLLYMGISQTDYTQWKPKPQLPSAMLCTALLLPVIGKKTGGKGKLLAFLPIAASLVTAGVTVNGLYSYSRGLSLHGISAHMESITACAMTVGYFALFLYVLDSAAKEWKTKGSNDFRKQLAVAAAIVILAILELPMNGIIYIALMLILWVIAPSLCAWKKSRKKS